MVRLCKKKKRVVNVYRFKPVLKLVAGWMFHVCCGSTAPLAHFKLWANICLPPPNAGLKIWQSVSRLSRVNEHVQELQTTGEGRRTGGVGLQSGPEVPHQGWDAEPHCHRKRKRRGGKVRVQRRCELFIWTLSWTFYTTEKNGLT